MFPAPPRPVDYEVMVRVGPKVAVELSLRRRVETLSVHLG